MTAPAASSRSRFLDFARDHVTYGIFILITLYFILFAPHFATLSTASAVLRITAIVSVMDDHMRRTLGSFDVDCPALPGTSSGHSPRRARSSAWRRYRSSGRFNSEEKAE